jgi:hypothetical protein
VGEHVSIAEEVVQGREEVRAMDEAGCGVRIDSRFFEEFILSVVCWTLFLLLQLFVGSRSAASKLTRLLEVKRIWEYFYDCIVIQ